MTPTASDTPTNTPVPTNTPQPSSTPSATNTPNLTHTKTPTPTRTLTPSNTPPATATPTATANLSTSLMALWNFEGVTGTTVPDAADGDNPATLQNGALIETTGANGSGLYLDGVNDSVTVANHADINKNGSFSLSAWINPSEVVTTRTQYLVQKGGASNDYGFITTSTTGTATPIPPATNIDISGKLVFTVGDLTPNRIIGPILPVDTWTLVTGVYDASAGQLRLYLNGALASVVSVTGTVSMSTGTLNFSPAGNLYHGRLDDVRFYNRALTDAEVTQLLGYFLTPTPLPSPTSTQIIATPTYTATPLSASALQWGTGSDGDLTIGTGATYNINTQNTGTRTCANGGDAVAYSVTALGSTVATLSTTPASGCLNPGDELMLLNLQGSTASWYNTGVYEFLRVASVSGNTVVFTTMKSYWYGSDYRSDANIGTGANQQRVMLMRVPNYEDVTINGTLTANAWNGLLYGVIAFRASGAVTGSGSVNINALGYRGGNTWGYGNGEGPALDSNAVGSGAWAGWSYCSWPEGGGGGYAASGTIPGGGQAYGDAFLNRIYLGAGGGGTGTTGPEGANCYSGGRGGGIIMISGQDINFGGSLTGNGAVAGQGGGGAGGSIRLEGNAINVTALVATGGARASNGRIAVYYQGTPPSLGSSTPAPYIALIGQPATPTPSPTPISLTSGAYGNGADGDMTVATGVTRNLNTQNSGTRSCANGGDAVAYSVTSLGNTFATLSSVPALGCLNPGDEVMLINLQGTNANYANTGNYEFLHIGSVSAGTITFTTSKTKFYGANAGDDTNIGTAAGWQRVMLMRVPNYHNVTINGTLTANAWNSLLYGVIAFRASGLVTGGGLVNANSLGYRGGNNENGEGPALRNNLVGSGAWQGWSNCTYPHGGGGGYAADGTPTAGGKAYGDSFLNRIFLGAGGGGTGTTGPDGAGCYGGGRGGGVVAISGRDITFGGSFTSNGANGGAYLGGGGAGGSIRVEGETVNVTTMAATGGNSASKGRIAVYYENTFSGSFTPGYLQKLTTPDTIFNDDFETGDFSQWSSSATDGGNLSPSDSAAYWGNYGMQAVVNDNNPLYVQDDSPAAESRFRARFYLNPNHLTMVSGDALDLFTGYTSGTAALRVQMQKLQSTTYDDRDPRFIYSSGWGQSLQSGNYAGTTTYSNTATSKNATFTFSGDQFVFYYLRNTNRGVIDIYIDGVLATALSENGSFQSLSTWTSPVLTNTTHTVKFVPESAAFVEIDAIAILHTYQIRAGLLSDAGAWTDSAWSDISDAWTSVEIDNALLGALTLWLNGVSKAIVAQVDNDTRTITEARLGAQGVETGTRGTIYFDDFESRRFSYIGLLLTPGVPDPQPTAPPAGWVAKSYAYAGTQPHAVTSVTEGASTDSYIYDANGNMTCRAEDGDVFIQGYNAENRIYTVAKFESGDCTTQGTQLAAWNFTYDGDGTRTAQLYAPYSGGVPGTPVVSAYFFGGALEVTGTLSGETFTLTGSKKYYSFAGGSIAMRDSTGLQYFLTDHLGSVMAVLGSDGTLISEQRYLPFGGVREDVGSITQTDFGYTGQRDVAGLGLMDYRARFYSPTLGRFIQPDTIIPDENSPQSLNRFSYVRNSPVNLSDPTGHCGVSAAIVPDPQGCMQDAMDAVAAYQSGNHNILSLVAKASGFERWSRESGDSVNRLNADVSVVFSNAPASERFPHAVHLGVWATSTSATIVGTGQIISAAAREASLVGELEICSFDADTPVVTQDGEKAIATVKVGDFVLSYYQQNKTIGFYPVTAVLVHTDKTLTEVIINGERIETTPAHPFYTAEKGWLPAGELQIGMHIRKADGKYGLVWFTWSVSQTRQMYNLTVSTAHTFFVGQGQWLVHNACPIRDIRKIEQHLQQFGPDDPNTAMINRLKAGKWTSWDQNFANHELTESKLMGQGMEYETAHQTALQQHGIQYGPGYEAHLYHPNVVAAYPDNFSFAAQTLSKLFRR